MRFNPNVLLKKGSPRVRDVKNLQFFLNVCLPDDPPLLCDGALGEKTERAVCKFQKSFGLLPTGVFGFREFCVGSATFLHPLQSHPPKDFFLVNGCTVSEAAKLAPRFVRLAHLQAAANCLDVELPTICAVFEVESAGAGFHVFGTDQPSPQLKPVILYERHIAFRRAHVHCSDAEIGELSKFSDVFSGSAGGYRGGLAEWARVEQAIKCGMPPALAFESCSWGLFQILGMHWKLLGFASIDEFVQRQQSEQGQLDTFIFFIKNERLQMLLRSKDWAAFARRYNGPAFAKNQYDTKLAKAYAFWKKHLNV